MILVTISEPSGREDLLNQPFLSEGDSAIIFVFVELDSKVFAEASFFGETKTVRFQFINKGVDRVCLQCGNAYVIHVDDYEKIFLVHETWVIGGLCETHVLEGSKKMLVPKPWHNSEAILAFVELETSASSMPGAESPWQVDPHGFW